MNYRVASVASHSALDVYDGVKDEGFETIALCKKGREAAYKEFHGIIDYCFILNEYRDIAELEFQRKLIEMNSLIVPNRSMAVYLGYDTIEKMEVKFFGNKMMLRWEEREGNKNYYRILDDGGIRRPKTLKEDEIDGAVMVKMPEAKRKVERGFFIAVNREDFDNKINELTKLGIIDEEGRKHMVIEEFVLGAHFNLNYFYSKMKDRLELLSIDRRIQSDWDGFYRLPAEIQLKMRKEPRLIEVGHIPVTIRESLLEKVFDIGKKFVESTIKLERPGIIGPFTLQVMVTPDLDLVVYDVAPRIGGGTNAYMGIGSQYSKFYFGKPISLGRRIGIEIKEAIIKNSLHEITT
ncbi:formate--phosphoribosylaminoimidazolecarboxamide ligase family protein [Sulfuracidifex tepidarius]|uniref:5-formaminoimidazole-4-carboxamide-1-(Beta)-D-ribofuranosyl 5'-monophosphate synthetase n=1 Tax=Sulfuracidifex tepidarius TaxID=1294262 RepID=A0A510E5D2_9CREN|nr:formate--phosphoribosylaminoimidazolecarboxamide ligase family protein [Sulfuracidifex tepidarius]BBG24490.1 5-formaminoimidazole-4-carboxamide-1-(beta)-D-ribofuranosyl 5'-monophosphate synthetase [Sulfuracidifex tepidarius]BBG27248.1 5-formaminoimidazole-4-carboxamide-1-(beta)-D-ribofuranosyl 5'-monophosphate synthetase [Sulfuracidifex tepidarius]